MVFSVLGNTGYHMVVSILMPQHVRDLALENPGVAMGAISAMGVVPAVLAAILAGTFSDRTRSRFGRRTPWVVVGTLVYAFAFVMIPTASSTALVGWWFCVGGVGLNVAQAPLIAVISDRVPIANHGLASSALGGGWIVGQAIGMIAGSQFLEWPWLGYGMAGLFLLISGLGVLLVQPPEGSAVAMPRTPGSLWEVLSASLRPPIAGARDFWKVFAARSLLVVSYQMVSAYQLYIVQDYLELTSGAAARVISMMAIATMTCALLAVVVIGPLSDKVGQRKPFIVAAAILFAWGASIPWIYPHSLGMVLYAGIAGFGFGMFYSVDQALNVQVLPTAGEAGKDLAFMNIGTFAGQPCAVIVASTLVTLTAGYSWVFVASIACAFVAIPLICSVKRAR